MKNVRQCSVEQELANKGIKQMNGEARKLVEILHKTSLAMILRISF